MHPDEDLQAAALREVAEETNIALTTDDLREDFADTHLYQPKPETWKRVVNFLAAAPVDPKNFVRSDEHNQHAWLNLEAAIAQCQHDALRRTLRRAAATLPHNPS